MSTRSSAIRWAFFCAILGIVYVLLAGLAAARKSATYDEPLHVATGWLNLYRGDFRLSPDVPPLWEYWIALPLGQNAMEFDSTDSKQSLDHRAIAALYSVPPADGIRLVALSRAMSLPLAVMLAMLVAAWAAESAGPVAAGAAMFAFVFDPNWLGHGPLAKNDVAFALFYFAAAYALWHVCKRPTVLNISALILLPALCLGTKFSGLLLGPLIVICLIFLAFTRQSWFGLQYKLPKLAFAGGICLAAILVSWFAIWAQYRFRFDAGLDMTSMLHDLRDAEVRSTYHVNQPTLDQLDSWRPGMLTRFALGLNDHKIVPQAWAAGLIYIQSQAGERMAYLLGQTYPGGKWIYFPLAWLFKEPLALLLAALIAAVLAIRNRRAFDFSSLIMLIFAGTFLLIAMAGSVNIGLRHIFAVLPFLDVAIGVMAANLWRNRRLGRVLVILLACGLMTETLFAFPDFLSFFNIACGGPSGGLSLLGDSNLDWGQDLPLLAQWQAQNPNEPLYLDYFGTCDPAAYGIRYVNVPGGYVYGPPPMTGDVPGVAAISATKLQGLFGIDPADDFATQFHNSRPFQILGGSIYLFNYSPAITEHEKDPDPSN